MFKKGSLVFVALFTLGAGPCDMLLSEDDDEGTDGGFECTEIGCANSFTIEVIRSDNREFLSGAYSFDVIVPDVAQYQIDCFMSTIEYGLDCSMGNLDVLFAQLEQGGQTIWVTLLGAPESTIVTVKYNDLAIGQRSFIPGYDEVSPNGPECTPTCYEGKETMAVESW